MHKLTRHALLASVTVAALLTTGCSSSSPIGADDAGAAAPEIPAAVNTQDELAVVQAPLGKTAPTAVATQNAAQGGAGARKSSLKVASYDKKTGRAVIAAKSVTAPADGEKTPPSTSPPKPPNPPSPPLPPLPPPLPRPPSRRQPAPPQRLLPSVTSSPAPPLPVPPTVCWPR